MSIYEYWCSKGDHIIEKVYDHIPEEIPQFVECEKCSTKKITVFAKRILSSFMFNFKGGAPTKKFYS